MTRTLATALVRRNETVARDTVILTLAVELPSPPRPGQFAMVHPMSAGCLLPRPFSILDYRDGEMEILVKRVGKGSDALCRMQKDDTVRVFAPLGSWFGADAALADSPLILVAGGVGIVPLFWLSQELAAAGKPFQALLGARSEVDVPRNLLARGPAWETWVESTPDATSRHGLVTAGLVEALERWPDANIATCGPTAMMHAVQAIAHENQRPLWVCLEEQMGCGAGVCRACVIEDRTDDCMRTVCKDGPVFRADTIRFGAACA